MKKTTPTTSTSRRSFLAQSALIASTPYFYSLTPALAQEVKEEKIPIGLIGAGGMGSGNMRAAKNMCQVVAIADVDSDRREKANKDLGGGKADMYEDYRKILDRKDINVVHVATPDHWHTKPLVEAMLAGKDIYCEKPMTLTIDEGKLIRKVQKETGAVVQVGTQQRSTFHLFVKAMALVNEGRVGKIKSVQCAIGGAPTSPEIPVADVPSNLNWDRWLGPAPATDYRFLENPKGRRPNTNCHYEFRWWYEYSGGKLTDWGAHHVDIANWALQLNGQTAGLTSIGGTAEHPVDFKNGNPVLSDRYNTASSFLFTAKYPGGTEMVIRNDTDNGVLIEGDKGRIFVNRRKLVGKPVEDLESNPLPEDAISKVYKNMPLQLNERAGHWANFFHCVKERIDPISDVHTHMQGLNICHLAGISARLGREIKWDAKNEQVIGDELANSMLARPYRKGYEIEMG